MIALELKEVREVLRGYKPDIDNLIEFTEKCISIYISSTEFKEKDTEIKDLILDELKGYVFYLNIIKECIKKDIDKGFDAVIKLADVFYIQSFLDEDLNNMFMYYVLSDEFKKLDKETQKKEFKKEGFLSVLLETIIYHKE